MPKPDISNWKGAYGCLYFVATTKTPGSIYDVLVRSEEAGYFAWALAAVAPWEQLPDPTPSKSGGKPPLPLATLASREGFRAPNKLTDVITAAHRHRLSVLELKDAVRDKAPYCTERDRFGMTIRGWDSRGGHWRLQVLYALLVEVMERSGDGREAILTEWQRFLDHLEELEVMDAPAIKRLVDGNQLARELGVKPGRWMAAALDVVMAWQLRHLGEKDPAGAIEEVRSRKEELGIP